MEEAIGAGLSSRVQLTLRQGAQTSPSLARGGKARASYSSPPADRRPVRLMHRGAGLVGIARPDLALPSASLSAGLTVEAYGRS